MSERPRIPALDGLRACAVMAVVLGHAALSIPEPCAFWRRAFAFYPNAELGVHVFFVISGYLITHLLVVELEESGAVDLRAFYVRRVRRIFPVFYAYIGVMAGAAALGWIAVSRVHLASAAAFAWNYKNLWDTSPGPGNWYVAHFWTLALEEQFYLVWPAVLACAGLRGGRRVAIGVVAALPVVRAITYATCPAMRAQLGMMFHTALDTIMVGCLFALCAREVRGRVPAWLALACAAWVLGVDPRLTARFAGRWQFTVGLTLRAACIAACMTWLIEHARSAATRLLESRPFVHLGRISYSLYVWQQLVLVQAPFPANLVLALCVAEVSFRVVETPFLTRRARPADTP